MAQMGRQEARRPLPTVAQALPASEEGGRRPGGVRPVGRLTQRNGLAILPLAILPACNWRERR